MEASISMVGGRARLGFVFHKVAARKVIQKLAALLGVDYDGADDKENQGNGPEQKPEHTGGDVFFYNLLADSQCPCVCLRHNVYKGEPMFG